MMVFMEFLDLPTPFVIIWNEFSFSFIPKVVNPIFFIGIVRVKIGGNIQIDIVIQSILTLATSYPYPRITNGGCCVLNLGSSAVGHYMTLLKNIFIQIV